MNDKVLISFGPFIQLHLKTLDPFFSTSGVKRFPYYLGQLELVNERPD